jgi:hypothetical protein
MTAMPLRLNFLTIRFKRIDCGDIPEIGVRQIDPDRLDVLLFPMTSPVSSLVTIAADFSHPLLSA